MKLAWHLLAFEDREAIFDYLVVRNPQAAVDTDERIETALNRLIDHPDSGREGRLAGTREVVIDGTRYIAAYRVQRDAVLVLRLLHGARQWPDSVP
ncbi:type II toxin-antitoxin system RelE/ParE family toxin [Salinicola socius]|uniref:Addiction module toxin RelE n=1 Tax=Salinicola socius TaxID=404433 RepID=A0A1Q8SNE7_9GAMM|nr:type II toxin-antitoxin system RelE/ParE family toxin [Salinicola socius]OLO02989.1 addiction module toxin RelE [Salinicola socius]